jgi:peptidoglycan pentaglycine glycine transferase (the first glycine)
MTVFLARELPELMPEAPLALEWEALVQARPESGFMQGLPWAAFKKRQGLDVVHVGLFEHNRLVGGTLAYVAQRSSGASYLISPDGPVLPWRDELRAQAGMRALHEVIAGVARARGAIAWRLEPRLEPPLHRALRNFRRAPIDLLPSESLLLDLRPPPEDLLSAMRPKGRYNIRLAGRKGVFVEEAPPGHGLESLYAVLEQTARRDGFFLEPPTYFAQLLETLGPSGHARVFVARGSAAPDDAPLGVLLLITYGNRATYLYGGIADHDRHRMAGYALQWAAILRARELGCEHYDFYGFEPYGRPEHLYARFSRFKRQFGGRPVQYSGAHEHLFLDRLADAVVRAVREIGWS